jgi:hypothetical protein
MPDLLDQLGPLDLVEPEPAPERLDRAPLARSRASTVDVYITHILER